MGYSKVKVKKLKPKIRVTPNTKDIGVGMVFIGTLRGYPDSGNLFSKCGGTFGNGAIFSIDKPGRWFEPDAKIPIDDFQLVDLEITVIPQG